MAKRHPDQVNLPDPSEPFLTRLQACRLAHIGLSTFDREVARGRLKVIRTGQRGIKVTREEIERYMRK